MFLKLYLRNLFYHQTTKKFPPFSSISFIVLPFTLKPFRLLESVIQCVIVVITFTYPTHFNRVPTKGEAVQSSLYISVNKYPFPGELVLSYKDRPYWVTTSCFALVLRMNSTVLHIVSVKKQALWGKGRLTRPGSARKENKSPSFFHHPNQNLLGPRHSAGCA